MIVQASDTAERKPQEDESSSGETPRSHLLIAGTGRAGTSFLVRYFHALGLDTHLSRHPQSWSELANAGLEDLPFPEDKDLPYVVKTPWLAEFIEQLLRGDFKIDAVLIPVRDLRDAASSRCIVEHGAIYSTSKWMLSMDDTWDEWGLTPGGVIYSLDPVDLERLLAVKFAHLVHALVKAGVNMIFLNFPRITEDGEYLFSKVQDFLPTSIDLAAAVEAHRQVVDKGSVRVPMERKAARDSAATVQAPESPLATPAPERSPPRFDREVARSEVDLVALRREIARNKAELRDVNAVVQRLQETEERLREMQAHSARLEATVSRLRGRTLKGIFQRMFLSR